MKVLHRWKFGGPDKALSVTRLPKGLGQGLLCDSKASEAVWIHLSFTKGLSDIFGFSKA